MTIKDRLKLTKNAALQMAVLTNDQKNTALRELSRLLEEKSSFLLEQNARDLAAFEGSKNSPLFQRLKLDQSKIKVLRQGIDDLIRLSDPCGQILSRLKLDDGLILERQSVPIGVLGIIFESRPDVIPQILSLVLKSGNAAVLKGGKEATYSNRAFMQLIEDLNQRLPGLSPNWASLIDTREDVQEMLQHHEYIDLVIPRGSNQLVQMVMKSTKIPVLGHADGVCHLYVHEPVDQAQALKIIIDAKSQYPSACNSVETVLVDEKIAHGFLPKLELAARLAKIQLKGCEQSRKILPRIGSVRDDEWHHEYSDLILSLKVVSDLSKAIEHINTYGSHHTDGILTTEPKAQEIFMNAVDSASVMVNASLRFADGFRYGMGAEVGVSTSKLHARGPVGIEGLIIYKYRLKGSGQVVADYVGENAKPFLHEREL